MIRYWVVLVFVACGVAVASSASGAPERSVPIRVGQGIGPVNLGMTAAQVRRALGRPQAVVERRTAGGQPYVELEYALGAWAIGFLGRPGSRRVVLIATGLARHRTPEGVGVGTTEGQFWRRVRGKGYRRRHCERGIVRVTHWVIGRGGVETVFFPGGPFAYQEVHSVEVRRSPAIGCAF
jgi:hypothetical protein